MKEKMKKEILTCLAAGIPLVTGAFLLEGVLRWVMLIGFAAIAVSTALSLRKIYYTYVPKLTRGEKEAQITAWVTERQDPGTMKHMRMVSILLNVVSFAVGIAALARAKPYSVWCGACLICFSFSVLLPARFPAYFSLYYGLPNRTGDHRIPVNNTLIAFFIPLSLAGIGSLDTFGIPYWKALVRAMGIAALLVAVLLHLTVPRQMRGTGDWISAVFLFFLFSFGAVLPLNHMLAVEPPEYETVCIEDSRWQSKSGPNFDVTLADGRSVSIPVTSAQYHTYSEGDWITVEVREGGLGIRYVYFP